MQQESNGTPPDSSTLEGLKGRSKSEPIINSQEIATGDSKVPAAKTRSAKGHQRSNSSTAFTLKQRSSKHQKVDVSADRKRSGSLTSIEDLKNPQSTPEKTPLLARLSRSWSRRLSAF